jgi:hypothetical protein
MNAKVPWAWLKETPEGSRGIVPGLGMSYYHPRRDALRAAGIYLDNGKEWIAVQRTTKGWTQPARVNKEEGDTAEFRARCETKKAPHPAPRTEPT